MRKYNQAKEYRVLRGNIVVERPRNGGTRGEFIYYKGRFVGGLDWGGNERMKPREFSELLAVNKSNLHI